MNQIQLTWIAWISSAPDSLFLSFFLSLAHSLASLSNWIPFRPRNTQRNWNESTWINARQQCNFAPISLFLLVFTFSSLVVSRSICLLMMSLFSVSGALFKQSWRKPFISRQKPEQEVPPAVVFSVQFELLLLLKHNSSQCLKEEYASWRENQLSLMGPSCVCLAPHKRNGSLSPRQMYAGNRR